MSSHAEDLMSPLLQKNGQRSIAQPVKLFKHTGRKVYKSASSVRW